MPGLSEYAIVEMRYVKITPENADVLVVDGSILAHCKEILPENEADEIIVDRVVDVDGRIDSKGVLIIMPDGTDSSKYEIDHFTDGTWWLEDFSKEKQSNADGGLYVFLICGIILLLLSLSMFINNTSISGFQGPGRFGGNVTKGSVSAPFVFTFGLILCCVYIGMASKKK